MKKVFSTTATGGTTRLLLAGLLCGLLSLPACTHRKKMDLRIHTYALANAGKTSLGKALQPRVSRHPGKSGFYLLGNGIETFALLISLIDRAEKTLDLQYFLFHYDRTGKYMAYKLLQAADRGVRIRLLLDDIFASNQDRFLALLDAHPNIEVRLFNRISEKKWLRYVRFLVEFMRVNRRMHNKVFVVDNQVAVVGGRNIGDAYYTANKRFLFSDLDVLSVGPVVDEISTSFDTYWNTRWASNLVYSADAQHRAQVKREHDKLRRHAVDFVKSSYGRALARESIGRRLVNASLRLIWARYKVFYDPPQKVSGLKKKSARFMESIIIDYMERADTDVRVISPYFVPQRFGMRWIKKLRRKGVKLALLTNSYASNDTRVVHGGYKRYRRKLLKLGVELYELKPTAFRQERESVPWYKRLPKSTLHIKAVVVDRKYTFVSSVNLSPRSRYMNTEIAILIYGSEMADAMRRLFARYANLRNSFRVELVKRDKGVGMERSVEKRLVWITRNKGRIVRFEQEPYVWLFQHLGVSFINLLPIEDLL